MKEKINVNEYAGIICDALGKGGYLLNTNGDKFNSMVIGWGALGRCWNRQTYTVYVRRGRYTKAQLDKTGEFTISIPLDGIDKNINMICGAKSGRDIDKEAEAGLILEEPEVINTPGIKQYPLTIECKVLYAEEQDLSLLPKDIVEAMYPQDKDYTEPMANHDPHTAYIGEIVAAYIIK